MGKLSDELASRLALECSLFHGYLPVTEDIHSVDPAVLLCRRMCSGRWCSPEVDSISGNRKKKDDSMVWSVPTTVHNTRRPQRPSACWAKGKPVTVGGFGHLCELVNKTVHNNEFRD